MSGEDRDRDYRKLTAGIACGAIVLAGLAAGSHWHRASKAAGGSTRETVSASSARAEQSWLAAANLSASPTHLAKSGIIPQLAASAPRPAAASSPTTSPVSSAQAMKMYAAMPMTFEANNGQTDPRVKFLSRTRLHTFSNK